MSRLECFLSVVLMIGSARVATCVGQNVEDRKSADIQVWAIRATTKNNDISPELKSIADKLKKQFKYTGFKLEKQASGKADIGKSFTTPLIGDYQAKVTPKKNDGKRVELQIEVSKGKDRVLNTTVTLPVEQSQLMGGWKLDDTDALIVAVSAK